VSALLDTRPPEAGAGNGGVPGRRAVVRWAWRLFRREWRQQLLVLGLLTVAVGATVLGGAVAVNAPSRPNTATFGTANHLVTLPGADPRLAADVGALRQHFGTVDIVQNQRLATGSAATVDLRSQDPHGRYGQPLLSLVSGHYPAGPGQVALTRQVATLFNLRAGDLWHSGGTTRRVVGIVENPQNLLDEFALVVPGQVTSPSQVTILFDATPASVASYHFPGGVTARAAGSPSSGLSPAVVVLAITTFGLVFIGLIAVAGFTVLAQRRLRALGMLGALGATSRNIRLVLVANGAVVGIMATLTGAALGFAAWFAYAPRLATSSGHRIDPLNLPWWAIGTAMALAIVTAIAAARRPARTAARLPVVAALSGRPPRPKAAHRSAGPAIVLLVVGPLLLAFAGGWGGNTPADQLKLLAGIVATTIGGIRLAPLCIAVLAAAGSRAPIAVRLALRDLARYRARSGAALAAISFAVLLAVLICVVATARFANVMDYTGPNLPANQLIMYTPYGAANSFGAGGAGLGAVAPSLPTSAQVQRLNSRVAALAASLGTRDVLALDGVNVTLQQAVKNSSGFTGTMFVATPAVLHRYGIKPGQIARGTDIITARDGLAALPHMQMLYGDAGPWMSPGPHPGENAGGAGGPGGSGGQGDSGGSGGPAGPSCPPSACVPGPKIQTFSALPTGVADPNTLVTTQAVRDLGLQQVRFGWLIETAGPLAARDINAARQVALASGATMVKASDQPSLSQLRNWSAVAGIILALGVLAMTVGLIRGETAADLRTLTATGAGRTTRRTLTAATAGALGLLGALLGTAVAYLACLAWFRSSLSTTVSNVPVTDLLIILVGLPLAATVGGWLFAGREPAGIARQPLE
jgi:putative ABC transport system permease protein